MKQNSKSHPNQHERAINNPSTRNLLRKLIAQWDDLNLVQRGEQLKTLKQLHCTDHGLAKALGVDPRTISRDIRIAELPAEQRARVAQGESANKFLSTEKDRQKRGLEHDARPQPATKDHPKPSMANLAHESRPQPETEKTTLRVEDRVEALEECTSTSSIGNLAPQSTPQPGPEDTTLPLQDRIEALEECTSKLKTVQENTVHILAKMCNIKRSWFDQRHEENHTVHPS